MGIIRVSVVGVFCFGVTFHLKIENNSSENYGGKENWKNLVPWLKASKQMDTLAIVWPVYCYPLSA